MSYSINQTSPYDGSGNTSSGGLRSGAGIDSVGQLRWEVGSETETYLDLNLSVWIHCIQYGYHTTGMLSTSLSCTGQTTYATTKGDCDLEKNDSQLLNPDTGIAPYYHTYRFYKTSAQQQFTINFSVTANGSKVKGTSSGSIILTLGPLTSHTISFNANNGSGSIDPITKYYDINKTLPSSGFTRSNYTLTGWNTKSDGSGTAYSLGQTYTVNSTTNITLYAQWKLNYVKPTITNATAYRTDSGGTTDPNGEYIKVSFTYTGGHSADTSTPTAPKYEIKINNSTPPGGSASGTMPLSTGNFNTDNNYGSSSTNYSTSATHTVTIKLYDTTDTTGITKTLTVNSAVTPIDLLVSGNNTYMGLMTPAQSGTILKVPSLNSAGAITASGAISCTSLTGSGQVQGATLKSTGNTTVGGALTTTGNATINGTLTAGTLGFIKAITAGQSYARSTAMGTITKIVAITKAGFITLTASIICEEDYSDTGTWYVGIAHNGTLRAGSGGRFTSSITPAIGGSATVNLAVANGDELVITFINTKASKKRWDITGLCFNCTATIS